jgi:hypothetical protein
VGASNRRITQLLLEADHSGVSNRRITQILLEVDAQAPPTPKRCYIVELERETDGYDRISRIYPYGGGIGADRVTLAACTLSPPSGYTLSTSGNYLEYDAAPSRVDAVVSWGDIGNQDDENASAADAANTLYYAAYSYLRKRIAAAETYKLRVVGLEDIAYPGETMAVTFVRYIDGTKVIDIDDDDLNILEVTTEISAEGVRTLAMQLSTTDIWPETDAGMVADMEQRLSTLERGGASLSLGRVTGGGDTSALEADFEAHELNANAHHDQLHHATHENGGADEIDVTDLSGLLADAQTAAAHDALSATHGDTDPDTVVRGDLIAGIGATPLWTRVPLVVPGAGILNYLGVNNGEVEPSWKSASSNPGAAASLLATDASGYLTLTRLTTTAQLVTSNAEVTVASKNKYLPYLQDASAVYLRKQTYYWTGAAYAVTTGYGFGEGALGNNKGRDCAAVGYKALEDNTGNYSSGFGYQALQLNTGVSSSGFGYESLQHNTGVESTAVGYRALQYNTGKNASALGINVMAYNSGQYCAGFGQLALQNNSGHYSNGFGYYALCYGAGGYNNAFGYGALQYNSVEKCDGIGHTALRYNNGARSSGIGYQALYWNNWIYAVGIGYQSATYFLDDAATDQTFTDAEITANTITFTGAHGFGVTGMKVNLRFSTIAGTPPTGLVHNTIYQFTITSATVMTLAGIGTNASGDFEGKLTNSVDTSYGVALGYNANPSKAHQVVLGGTDIVETLLRGQVLVNTTVASAELTVDQSSTTGAVPVLTLDQADVSEEFLRLIGESAADNTQSLIDAADLTTPGAIVGWYKVYVEDVAASGAIPDGYYWQPLYAMPTA